MMTTNNFLLLFFWFALYGCIAFWLLVYMCYMVYIYWITLIWIGRAALPRIFGWYNNPVPQRVLSLSKKLFLLLFIPLGLCGFVFLGIASLPRLGAIVAGFCGFANRMGSGSIFGIKQTPEFIAIANYVLVYGTFHLAVTIGLGRMSNWIDAHPHWRWLRRLSVFNGWAEFSQKSGMDKFRSGLFMLLRYVGSWLLGLIVVSPVSLLIPGFWDPVIAIPETIMVVLAGLVWLPFVVSVMCVRGSLIPMIRDALFSQGIKAGLRRFYRLVLVPIICLLVGLMLWLTCTSGQVRRHDNVKIVATTTAASDNSSLLEKFTCKKCGHIHWPGAEFVLNAVGYGLGLIMLVLSWGSLICMIGGLRGSVAAVTCWIVIAIFCSIKDSVHDYYLILSLCR